MLTNKLKIDINSLEGTAKFAKMFAKVLEPGVMICLYGPIGSGKTTFVQFVCRNLNVTEPVTSPSFVIINEYNSGKFPIYHFDLYRLEKEGIDTIISELEEYSSDNGAITFVEWAEFSQGNLLEDRFEIIFSYDNSFSDTRLIEIQATGPRPASLLERLKKEIADCKF